jgi:hypothetical protein
MIKYSNTDENKITLSYQELYSLVSRILKKRFKDKSLSDIRKQLAENDINVSLQILSQIKNRRLPHEYPTVIENLCRFFGVSDIVVDKKTLFTIDKEELDKMKKTK